MAGTPQPPTSPNNTIKNVFTGVQSQASRWFRHISEAADAYKMREGRARRPDLMPAAIPPLAPDTAPSPAHHDEKDTEAGETGAAAAVAAPAAPESTDSGFQEGIADTGHSTLPSDTSSPEELAKKTAAGLVRRSSSGRSSTGGDLTRLTEEAPLIQPSEVVVCRRDVLLAEPVLTPIERLRREDEAIVRSLARKQEIVCELLHIPPGQFHTIAELASEPTSSEKESSEIALACFHQTTRLTTILNESLRVSEEEAVSASSIHPSRHKASPTVPAHLLQEVCSALNAHVTHMMRVSKERDEERELLRREAQRLREQVHAMHEQRRGNISVGRPKRRATATGLTSTPFLLSEATNQQSTEDPDNLSDQPLDTEPSQEEFVDAVSGEGTEETQASSLPPTE